MLETCSKDKCRDCARQVNTNWLNLFSVIPDWNLSRNMTKPTKWLGVQRRLRSLSALKKAWVLSYPLSTQQRLIRLGRCPGWSEYAGCTLILLVFSCHGSFLHQWPVQGNVVLHWGVRWLSCMMSRHLFDGLASFSAKRFDVGIVDRSRTEHFLAKNVPAAVRCFNIKCVNAYLSSMQLSKEIYERKRIHNGCSVQIENSVTWDNCLASLGKPCDAKQLPSWWNFQSAPHNHLRFLQSRRK